ncbi:hypothetical protein SLEP1_g2811 [Rubroshorea leprosula]|uniref:Probable purine permease n=1 Tax=Rubroshorea leprosula TaxID=152421 RepID=A0AAV5HQP0_9ROSI|nr:hypothetical protein SLEP1_g2811 [Rubroshorea leprosula]
MGSMEPRTGFKRTQIARSGFSRTQIAWFRGTQNWVQTNPVAGGGRKRKQEGEKGSEGHSWRRKKENARGVEGTSFLRSASHGTMNTMPDNQEPILNKKEENLTIQSPLLKLKRWKWWLLVVINIFFLLAGQAAAVLLGRFYYDQGGNSKWMATLVQTAGFPILFIPLFLLPSKKEDSALPTSPSVITLGLVYFFLGAVIAGDNMLYSVGLLYLSASTYSLICATQLAANAVFSYFINSQKFTALILNSVIILSLSAALIAVNDDSETPSGVAKGKYIIGFLCTLGASILYSLLLSLMQLSFQKILKKETFSVVLEMQIYTALVATIMNGVKIIAMLLAFWGFASYIYQNYLDDIKMRKSQANVNETRHDLPC